MENLPLISVIIPVYNAEKYLDKCLNSVLNQRYKNLEIILVDDVSTNNSLKICKEFAEKDNRIKIIQHKMNKGDGETRNTGLKNATGEYISFIDADDFIEEDFISILYSLFDSPNILFTICSYAREKGDIVLYSRILNKETYEKDYLLDLLDMGPVCWNKLYKTSLIKNIKFLSRENGLVADVDFIYKIIFNNLNMIARGTKKILYHYRDTPLSLMNFRHMDHKRIYPEVNLKLFYFNNVASYTSNKEILLRTYEHYVSAYYKLMLVAKDRKVKRTAIKGFYKASFRCWKYLDTKKKKLKVLLNPFMLIRHKHQY